MIEGLKLGLKLKSNDRFDSYKASYKGKTVFAKQAKTEKSLGLLKNQADSAQLITNIGAKWEAQPIRAPVTLAKEGTWLITEWLPGKSLSQEMPENDEKVAKILSTYFYLMDHEQISGDKLRDIFTEAGLKKRIDERLPQKAPDKAKQLIGAAYKLFCNLRPYLEPILQDADIKPAHLFRDKNNKNGFILIDSEHMSREWPRFYDLANNFTKYWVRDEQNFCRLIVNDFLELTGINSQKLYKPLLATLLVRACAMSWSIDYEADLAEFKKDKVYALIQLCLDSKSVSNLL